MHNPSSNYSLLPEATNPTRAIMSMMMAMIIQKIMNGMVKQHFLKRAAHIPRHPVRTTNNPTIIARRPKSATGDGYFVSPISQVSFLSTPKNPKIPEKSPRMIRTTLMIPMTYAHLFLVLFLKQPFDLFSPITTK